jgi:hypothetical protein
MLKFNSLKNTAEKIFTDKKYVAILGTLATLNFMRSRFLKPKETKNNKTNEDVNIDKTNNEVNVDIEKLKNNTNINEKSNSRHVNIVYVKELLETSISYGDISDLEHSVDVLEGVISGYKILNEKSIDNEYNIEYTLYKLNKYRIKSYYNLACLYLNNYDYNKANYYLIKSVDSCDPKDCSHHKYIRSIFCKLRKTNFIC